MIGTTIEALGVMLGANVALIVAYYAYISPKNDEQRVKRKRLLDKKVNSEIKKFKDTEATIKDLLPLFEEYKKIDQWDGVLKSVSSYFLFSVALTVCGIFFCVFDSPVTLAGVTAESLFAIGGGLFLVSGLMGIIFHQVEVHDWKVKNDNGNPITD